MMKATELPDDMLAHIRRYFAGKVFDWDSPCRPDEIRCDTWFLHFHIHEGKDLERYRMEFNSFLPMQDTFLITGISVQPVNYANGKGEIARKGIAHIFVNDVFIISFPLVSFHRMKRLYTVNPPILLYGTQKNEIAIRLWEPVKSWYRVKLSGYRLYNTAVYR